MLDKLSGKWKQLVMAMVCHVCDCSFGDGGGETGWVHLVNTGDQS